MNDHLQPTNMAPTVRPAAPTPRDGPERARDNASATQPSTPAHYIEDTPNRTRDMCRYAPPANVSLPTTDSGRLAIFGQSYMAASVQNPMSADSRDCRWRRPHRVIAALDMRRSPNSGRSLRRMTERTIERPCN